MAQNSLFKVIAGLSITGSIIYFVIFLSSSAPRKIAIKSPNALQQMCADYTAGQLTQTHQAQPSVASPAEKLDSGDNLLSLIWKQLSLWGQNAIADNPVRWNEQVQVLEQSDVIAEASDAAIHPRHKDITQYFRGKGMKAVDGLGIRQPVSMTEIEKRYMEMPELVDIKRLAHEQHSKVVIVSPKNTYKVGDKLQLRVDVHDQLGRIREAGGDEVRIWLKGPTEGSSVPMEVSDLGNGSYLGEATLRWEGTARVWASLTYAREFLRLVVELRHSLVATRWVTGKFTKEGGTEITPCLPSAPIPGYARTCNYTLDNGLSPWFCGRPATRDITCGHLIYMEYLGAYSPLPLSGPVLEMNTRMHDKNRGLRLIPNNILISTHTGPPPPKLPPCWSRPKRESWELPSHRGWMKKPGEWIPDNCALPAYTPQRVRECLRNTTVLLLGDSNMRLLLFKLEKALNKQSDFWYGQRFFQDPQLNSSVLFFIHAHPFHSGSPFPVMRPVSVGRALAGLPAGGQYIIVLHYYLHFAYYPLAVFRDRVRSAKRAVKEFLRTHPTAKVFIRGPHVVYGGWGNHPTNGDKCGPWFLQILKQEFQDLYDRVWLLDFWPMTTASENMDTHPLDYVIQQIMSVLFGYACDKL